MFTSLRDRSVAASASTRIAGAVPRRHINDRRKPADSRRIDRVDSRNRELIPSGSGMTSLTAAHALSSLRSFLSLSLCLIDDYGSDLAPLASDRFADLEIEIGERSRGASARDATCVTSKVQNCN